MGREHRPPQPRKCQYRHSGGRTGLGSPPGQGLLPSDKSDSPECQWNLITSGVLMSSGAAASMLKKQITKMSSPDTQVPLTDVIACKRSEKMEMLANNERRKESTYKSFNSNGIGRTPASPVCTASAQSNATALGLRREKRKINY